MFVNTSDVFAIVSCENKCLSVSEKIFAGDLGSLQPLNECLIAPLKVDIPTQSRYVITELKRGNILWPTVN